MYKHNVHLDGQDAAGLDMFVGSGIDYLSEVNLEDMELDLFNPSPSTQLNPETFMNYAPLAASLGPPGSGMRFGSEPSPPAGDHFTQRASWATAGARQPGNFSLGVGSACKFDIMLLDEALMPSHNDKLTGLAQQAPANAHLPSHQETLCCRKSVQLLNFPTAVQPVMWGMHWRPPRQGQVPPKR